MKTILISMLLLVLCSGCTSLFNPEVASVEKFGRPVFAIEFRKDYDVCYEEWESSQPVTNVGGRLVLVHDVKVFKEKRNEAVWKCLREQKGYKAKKRG